MLLLNSHLDQVRERESQGLGARSPFRMKKGIQCWEVCTEVDSVYLPLMPLQSLTWGGGHVRSGVCPPQVVF